MSDPAPTADDYRRADLLMEGAGSVDPALRELFAVGIAVARTGGDVKAFLRRQLPHHPRGEG